LLICWNLATLCPSLWEKTKPATLNDAGLIIRPNAEREAECEHVVTWMKGEESCRATLCEHGAALANDWVQRCTPLVEDGRIYAQSCRGELKCLDLADGLRALCERFGYTHEDVARKGGKSRSTVTEALSIASIPASIRQICRESEITSKSLLLQIVRQPDDESMRTMAEQIASEGLTRDGARKARRAFVDPTGASEPFVYRYEAPGREFRVEVKFKKANISAEELFDALNAAAQGIDEAT